MSLSLFSVALSSVPVWLCSQEAFCAAQRWHYHSKLRLTKRTDPEGIDECCCSVILPGLNYVPILSHCILLQEVPIGQAGGLGDINALH